MEVGALRNLSTKALAIAAPIARVVELLVMVDRPEVDPRRAQDLEFAPDVMGERPH
jgi:hypothetical protein